MKPLACLFVLLLLLPSYRCAIAQEAVAKEAVPQEAVAQEATAANTQTQAAGAAVTNAAATGSPPASIDAELPTAEAVKSQLDAVEADESIAETIKTRQLTALRAILDQLKGLASERERQASFVTSAQTAPDRIAAAKQTRESSNQTEPLPELPINLFEVNAIDQLRNRVSEADSMLNQARQARQEWEDRQRERQSRATSLPSLIADARTALADMVSATVGEQTDDPHGTVREAREKQRLVAIAVARQRLATLQAEQVAIEAETALVPLQIDAAAARVKQAETLLRQRTEQLGRQRQYQIENDLNALQQAAVRESVEIQQTLVWPLHDQWLDLARENARVRQQTASYRTSYDALDATYKEVSTEIGRDLDSREGLRSGLGLKLLRLRSRLPSTSQLRSEARGVDDRLEAAGEFQTAIDHALDGIGEFIPLGGTATATVSAAAAAGDDSQAAPSLDSLQRRLLTRMAADVESHINDLIELKSAIELKRRKAAELRNKIEVNVIWIRDTARFRWSGFATAWEALQLSLEPRRWAAAGTAMLATAASRWDWGLLWAMLAVVPLAIRRHWIQPWNLRPSAVATDRLPAAEMHPTWGTLRELVVSLYQALPLPATLWIAGSVLGLAATDSATGSSAVGSGISATGVAESATLLGALGDAMKLTAGLLLPLAWLNQLLRAGGVVERDFRYTREQIQPAHRAVRWLLVLGSPIALLWQIAQQSQLVDGDTSLARLLFALGMILVTIALRRVLNPHSGSLTKHLRDQPDSWLTRLQGLWYALPLLPLVLAFLSLSGYSYAAVLLAQRLHWSLWFAIALLLTSGMLTRWVQVRRTQMLRAAESQQQRSSANAGSVPIAVPTAAAVPARDAAAHPVLPQSAAAHAAVVHVANDASGGIGAPVITPAQRLSGSPIALAAIDAQTLRLLNAMLWMAVLVGVAWLWTPVLPAVRFLERVPLWNTTAADGELLTITLANLVMALPIIFLTWVAARNVPGLIETILLERLPIDRPARYAITSLASYAITVIGILLAAQTVGIHWQSVQWLVAALGVGLGFGLQEIFANFISGLILLFEQPIRVGDTITIGNTTGTVSRIRMRATIVTNGERQELVIPNKNLITERLINWTLTDTVNRIEIRLGLSHDADTQAACRLLEQICNQHEFILVDPKPSITFDSVSESALTIVVQCYLGQLGQRAQTLHELNTTIKQRMQEAGIPLAHAQRDIRVLSLPDHLRESAPQ